MSVVLPCNFVGQLQKGIGTGTGDQKMWHYANELHTKANTLASAATDPGNAIAVIVAFNTVKEKYDELASKEKYQQFKSQSSSPGEETPQGKVNAVETAWEGVNTQFQNLCKALIKDFANQVATESGKLAGGTPSTHANNVIDSFDVVEKAYNGLSDKSSLKSEFEAVKLIYDQILNLTKLHKAATTLHSAAQSHAATLTQPAGTLKTNVEALRDRSGDAQTNAKTVVTKFNELKDKFDELETDNKNKVESQFQAIIGLYNHIIIHYPKILQNAAGADQNSGLRGLADTLYTRANQLNNAVNNNDVNAAKVLKAKAGTQQEAGKLRKLAENLYTAANALHTAVQGAKVSDESAAQNLKDAVGAEDTAPTGSEPTTLRDALAALGNADPGTDLTTKAGNVKSKYDSVSRAFAEVKKKNDQENKYASHQDKYQAVEAAWDAFNNVYKPEELLMDSIGPTDQAGIDGQPKDLREALRQLADAYILSPDIHKKAQAVRDRYNDVLGKFELVKDQVPAYEADGSNIKTSQYTPLVTAWTAFDNLYREAIYPTKFWSIIAPSIISILSLWSPKTDVLLYSEAGDKQYKFGGWTEYKANNFGETGPVKGDPVYGWIWHFFDIIH